MEPTWVYGALFVVTVVHVAVAVAAYVFRGRVADPDAAADGGAVSCPHCEAENDPAYRYCRRCVEELPGDDALGTAPNAPRGRQAF